MRRSICEAVFFVALCAAMLSPIDAAAQLDPNSFSPVTWYGAGANHSYGIAAGDLDNDGFDDIVVSNQRYLEGVDHHTGVGIYINNGDGTFQLGPRYPTDGFAVNPWQSLAIADVDSDGNSDLVVLNSSSTNGLGQPISPSVSVMRGNGDGTLQAAVSYLLNIYPNTQVSPGRVAVADVNGDNKPDVLVADAVSYAPYAFVANFRGGVSVLLNNGNGTLAAPVLYDSGGYSAATTVTAADVNDDGFSDIVVSNVCSVPGISPTFICQEQVNGSLIRIPGTVGVLLGNGNGTFQPSVTYPSGGIYPGALKAADLNRDGKLDLIVEHGACFQCAGTATAVLIGNGGGTFQAPTIYPNSASTPVSVDATDVDGDGSVDAVVMNYCTANQSCDGSTGMLSVLAGNGDGTLQSASLYFLWAVSGFGYAPHTVLVRDLDNDGKPDVVVMGWTAFGVLLNQTPRSATATTLVSQPNPSGDGLLATLTATVSSAGSGVPSGTVTFREGATILGTAPLVNAVATLSLFNLSLGGHNLIATYSSDSNFRASDSTLVAHVVIQAMKSLTVAPAIVVGGSKPKGTVTLNGQAPPGGAVVMLSSGDPSAKVPASVKVAAGATSAMFTITTKPVDTTAGPFLISATYRGVTLSAPLTVLRPTPSTLTIQPASVIGGVSAQGTVKLTGPAPAGGALIVLASANASATVPATVTVAAGSTTAAFTVTTIPVATTQGPFDVSATYNGVTVSDTLIVKAPAVLSLVLDPPSVTGGGHSTGTVTLTGPAPSGGITVTVKSSKISIATVPSSVFIPATGTSATFDVSTFAVAASSAVTISAAAGPPTKKATLTVTP